MFLSCESSSSSSAGRKWPKNTEQAHFRCRNDGEALLETTDKHVETVAHIKIWLLLLISMLMQCSLKSFAETHFEDLCPYVLESLGELAGIVAGPFEDKTAHTASSYSDMRFISLVANSSQNVNRPRLSLKVIGCYFSGDWFQVAGTGGEGKKKKKTL